jgi:4-O-beta-D-mannosyl-D-glucose phosphorylase
MSENSLFETRFFRLASEYDYMLRRKNTPKGTGDGLLDRYIHPVITPGNIPLYWQYDLNPTTNPHLMIRQGIDSVVNAGAVVLDNKVALITRMEGYDNQFFFGIAESRSGIDQFSFQQYPVVLPLPTNIQSNISNMRLTAHEDGWIYVLYNSEQPGGESESSVYFHSIARSKDLKDWESLPDLAFTSPEQRICLLHTGLVNDQYLIYTQKLDEGGDRKIKKAPIALNYLADWENPLLQEAAHLNDNRLPSMSLPHSLLGPAPIRSEYGWLHLFSGLSKTPYGWRHVLQVALTDLDNPAIVKARPGGNFLVLNEKEKATPALRILHSNGWVQYKDKIFIYYTTADNRTQVMTIPMDRLLDYILNTPEVRRDSNPSLNTRIEMIKANLPFMENFHL